MPTLQQESGLEGVFQRVLEFYGLEKEPPIVREIENQRVEGHDSFYLHDPNVPDSVKQLVKGYIDAQKSFVLSTSRGDICISVGPCVSGTCCWVIEKDGDPRPI